MSKKKNKRATSKQKYTSLEAMLQHYQQSFPEITNWQKQVMDSLKQSPGSEFDNESSTKSGESGGEKKPKDKPGSFSNPYIYTGVDFGTTESQIAYSYFRQCWNTPTSADSKKEFFTTGTIRDERTGKSQPLNIYRRLR